MASVHNLDDDGGEVFKDRQTALVAGGSVFVNLAALLVVKIEVEVGTAIATQVDEGVFSSAEGNRPNMCFLRCNIVIMVIIGFHRFAGRPLATLN